MRLNFLRRDVPHTGSSGIKSSAGGDVSSQMLITLPWLDDPAGLLHRLVLIFKVLLKFSGNPS